MISTSEYIDAVKSGTFKDENLIAVERESSNLIHFESGQNAVVFKLKNVNTLKEYAVKLYVDPINLNIVKTAKLAGYISTLKNNYFVNFKIEKEFIYVDNENVLENEKLFPAVILEWINGKTLGTFVKYIISKGSQNELIQLTEKFKKLSIFIISSDFGHGDLKHDNIIVDSDFNLKLIDYDDMFIPAFRGDRSNELGTPSFQHPKRSSLDFNENIDDFSILSIYTSLLVLTKYPKLHEKYEDQQNLLFRFEDFENPNNSELFQFLDKDFELSKWSYLLKKALSNEHIYIPELKNYLNGIFPSPKIILKYSPVKILSGKLTNLEWEVDDSIITKLSTIGEVKNVDKIELKLFSTTTLKLSAENHFGKTEKDITIEVLPLPEVKEFKISRTKVKAQDKINISWNVKNVSALKLGINGVYEDVTFVGKKEMSFTDHSTINLNYIALDNQTIDSLEKEIEVFHPVIINYFNSDTNHIIETTPVNISWQTINCTKTELIVNMNETIDVTNKNVIELFPKVKSTYQLQISNELFKIKSELIEINVQKIPILPKFDNIIPIGIKVIPKLEIDFEFLNSDILKSTNLEFEKIMQPIKKRSLKESLRSILFFKK